MQHLRWAIAVLLVTFASGRAMAGIITYSLVDYPDLENGATLSGTITTDGSIGDLSAGIDPTTEQPSSHILSWHIQIKGTQFGLITTSSSDPPAIGASGFLGGVATATAITIPEDNVLSFVTEQVELAWSRSQFGNEFLASFTPNGVSETLWTNSYGGTPTFSLGGDPWIIAEVSTTTGSAVPEPTSIVIALMLFGGLGLAGARRRARSKKSSTRWSISECTEGCTGATPPGLERP
jgi:hypothetical protein